MKVVAFNGSPRKEGNTANLIKKVFAELEAEGIETEFVQIGGKKIKGCTGCMKCFEKKDKKCIIDNDILNECLEKMIGADGIILGSPTYTANVSSELKALIDRADLVGFANENLFKRKVGAAVIAVRRGGAVPAFDAINHFFQIHQVIITTSIYWNFGIGLMPGDVDDDEEGNRTMKHLGENMAWLIKKIKA